MSEDKTNGPLWTLFQVSTVELPLAFQKWMLKGGSHEVEQAALKACHAWTSLANETISRVYQSEGFSETITHSVNHFLHLQRLGRDLLGTVATKNGVSSDQSDSSQEEVLNQEVDRLRREVRYLTARVNSLKSSHHTTANGLAQHPDTASHQADREDIAAQ